jgi:hypothetical protein
MVKKILIVLAKLAISLSLIFLLYRKIPLEGVKELLFSLDLRFIPLVFAILLVNTFLSAWKWHILLKSDGVDIGLRTLTGSYLVGTFFNMFLPSNIGGDSYRILDIRQRSNDIMRSATSVFADRLSGFFALVTLSLVSSVFVVRKTEDLFFFYLPFGIFLLLLCLILALYNQDVIRKIIGIIGLNRFERFAVSLEKVLMSFGRYCSRRSTVIAILLISFSFQFLVILTVFLLAKALGISVSFCYFSAFVPLISLMEALPISIYGIGIRDIGYVFFFGSVGMGDLQSRSLALLFLTLTIVYSLCGGLVLLARVIRVSKKK